MTGDGRGGTAGWIFAAFTFGTIGKSVGGGSGRGASAARLRENDALRVLDRWRSVAEDAIE